MISEEWTLKSIWVSILEGVWNDIWGRGQFGRAEIPRCDFCGRRLDKNCVSRVTFSSPTSKATFITTCLRHGDYDGQVVMDCFTAQNVMLFKEPAFYHEMAIFDEVRFYCASAFRAIGWFLKALPLNILQSISFVTNKAIERQKERLGYK